jgi:RecG-like helicase
VTLELQTPVKFVKRIGERIATGLHERGISTVEDLLYHLPFRYEDRLHPRPLSTYQPGEMASLLGEVRGTVLLRTRSGPIFEMTVAITPPPVPATDPGAPRPEGTWVPSTEKSPVILSAARSAKSKDPETARLTQTVPAISTPDPSAGMSGLLKPPPALETVKCLWFHGAYLKDKFRPGQRIALYGKLEGSRSGNALNAVPGSTKFKMVQPTFEILPDATATGEDAEFTTLEMGRIVPIYPSLGGTTPWGAKLTSRWLRRVLWTIFKELKETNVHAEETVPHALLERFNLPSRMEALEAIHFPAAGASMTELMSARTPAHRRLIFEELFYLELGLELKRRRLRERHGTSFATNDQVRAALKQVLPFKPTAAQKRVLGEIVNDMREPRPMRRLLQGDVGSGKTIVALEAALVAIENGYQVALMAPTEILATQHYLSARKLLASAISPSRNRPYRIALLTGSLDDRAKRDARSRICRGETDLAIGTHALVEEKVDFENLGLVIVDEQHRFGVEQRFKLMSKPRLASDPGAPRPGGTHVPATDPGAPRPEGTWVPPTEKSPVILSAARSAKSKDPEAASLTDTASTFPTTTDSHPAPRTSPLASEPDVLVMTATPIPRTLALTLYGDLEASILDELPPGRTPITTRRMPEERSAEVWDFVRKQVALGRQAYIVYPIIEGERDDQPELDFAPEHDTTANQPKTTTERQPTSRKKPRKAAQATLLATPDIKPKRAISRARLRSASEMHDELNANALNGLRLGLLHGRMSTDDKDVTMARFQRGELDVLVSTTVIEVGVDVPNATVMVIEHAERFGLAQMHQLRGRVGRGKQKSYCVLLTGSKISPEAELRLDAMVQTQDGFALAEIDLAQRGPGEFFGTRQAGLPEFRVANILRDKDLLELAKSEAAGFIDSPDPATTPTEREAIRSRLKHQWQRRYGLVEA